MKARLFAAFLLAALLAGCGAPPRPSVLLVVIDTLRKDHLYLYGYGRRTSDGLDRLAARGWVFENHIAHASQTVPSTLSLLLSRHPADHGFVHRELGQFMRRRPRFPGEFVFLAEVFREAGYATAGFVSNPFLSRHTGFDQGFEAFEHWPGDGVGEAEEIAARAVEWLDQAPKGPFFLYLHLMDVHMPYAHPEPYTRRFAPDTLRPPIEHYGADADLTDEELVATIAHYDAGIPYVGDQILRVVSTLDAQERRGGTIIAVTSDHGEEFLEHGGLGHATTVYGELVRVPLILIYPPVLPPGRRVHTLTQHVDLAPTLLDLAGLRRPPEFSGDSLFEEPARVYAENGPWRAVYGDRHKLVLDRRTNEMQLFAQEDELDQHPLPLGELARRLRSDLDRYLALEDARAATSSEGSPAPWSDEELEGLRALGYAD